MVRKLDPERREKFLASALKLFVSQGIQNTSTGKIAAEAGSAAGTLFLYYPTKQDLIHTLILEIARDQSQAINSLLDPSATACEALWIIWKGSINWFLEHMDAYLYVRQVRDSGMIAESVVQESNQYFTYYYDAIQKGLQQGSIQPYPVELIGGVLYQQIVAIMDIIRRQPNASLHEEYVRQGFEIFWNGIKKT